MTAHCIAYVVRSNNQARSGFAFIRRHGFLSSDLDAFIRLRCYIRKCGCAAWGRHAGMITRKSLDLQKERVRNPRVQRHSWDDRKMSRTVLAMVDDLFFSSKIRG